MEAYRIVPGDEYAIGSGHCELGHDYGVTKHRVEVVRVVSVFFTTTGPDIVQSSPKSYPGYRAKRWQLDPSGRPMAMLDGDKRSDSYIPTVVPLGHVLGTWADHEAQKAQNENDRERAERQEQERQQSNLQRNSALLAQAERMAAERGLYAYFTGSWYGGHICISSRPDPRPLTSNELNDTLARIDAGDFAVQMEATLALDLLGVAQEQVV